MNPVRRLRPLAACLALFGTWPIAAPAEETGYIETPSDKPDEERRAAEPPKPGSSEASQTRPADKEPKRRPGFRIKLPAEAEL